MEEKNVMVFPILVIIFSTTSMIYSLGIPNYFSILISIIGIIGGVLFVKLRKSTNYLLGFWLIGQIPYVTKTVFAESGEFVRPILEASQGFNLPFYLHLQTQEAVLYLGINVVPIMIIGVLKYFKLPYEKSNN